ncbi:ABC transporter substrate-binding protein [Kosakonia radicincitans DSM 16656]|uniref:ABC transporter substrate-binding protein n=1 Tax=Kosakonia TaxID=1330547 RepID=UPI000272D383|nr:MULTISPECIES: ABC transporter substrate-binding protein [Kosakonia]APG19577.1 ABC transporter substrate-binding protein [Kosakonia radicincitans]ARD59297.1 ABC transporter substrate-binding protein [Kosakonia radicincitans DSM 16656]KDE35671.1 ABC transporter substrate-binding protein [Kosakonia radicincitans UMEnt01/12]NCF06092.1 ABC transporter substrate-binding protein [Kosakonia sp. MH5]NCF08882.1 ABC transporter substrate-binding protein [Kosakonia sp. MH5]
MKQTLSIVAALSMALSAQGMAAEKFTFMTNWYAQAEHGGFYQAQAQNLYRDAGLDVTIKMGGPQVHTMQLMAAGQADCIISDNMQALESWQQGVEAVPVATTFQHSAIVFITHPDVKSQADLQGKTFLLAAEAYTSYWPWAQSVLNLKNARVRPYTFSVQPFLADKTLVQQGYVTSEPFAVQKAGAQANVYPISDWGYPPYGNSIVCMKSTIEKRPQAVAAFVKASMQGWKNYLENPAPGNTLIKKENPQMTDEQIAFGIAQMKKYQMLTGGDAQTGGIGIMTVPRLKQTWQLLVDNKLIDPVKVPFDGSYTLKFIEDVKVMP